MDLDTRDNAVARIKVSGGVIDPDQRTDCLFLEVCNLIDKPRAAAGTAIKSLTNSRTAALEGRIILVCFKQFHHVAGSLLAVSIKIRLYPKLQMQGRWYTVQLVISRASNGSET